MSFILYTDIVMSLFFDQHLLSLPSNLPSATTVWVWNSLVAHDAGKLGCCLALVSLTRNKMNAMSLHALFVFFKWHLSLIYNNPYLPYQIFVLFKTVSRSVDCHFICCMWRFEHKHLLSCYLNKKLYYFAFWHSRICSNFSYSKLILKSMSHLNNIQYKL